MVNSSTEHFAAQQQGERNKLLHSYGNNEHVCTAHSYIYDNSEKCDISRHFRGDRGYANASQRNAACTLPILFNLSGHNKTIRKEDRHFFVKFSVTICFTFCTLSLTSQCIKNNPISLPFAMSFGLHPSLTLLATLWPWG